MDKLTNSCRACLTTSESFSYFLYENIPPEMYWFCTSLEVKQDELPKSLCNCCYNLLTQFSEFKKICIQSENILHGLFNNLKLEHLQNCTGLKQELENGGDNNIENNNLKKIVKQETEEVVDNDNFDADCSNDIENYIEEKNINLDRQKRKGISKKRHRKSNLKSTHPTKRFHYTCDLCHKKFGFRERFDAHKLEHEGKITSIYCKPCNKTFATWGGLKRHNECEHTPLSVEQVTCKLCSKVFKSPRTLKIHSTTHGVRKTRICDVCGKEFRSDLTLKAHLETHVENRERRYTCQHCGKKFLSKKTCASHSSRRHTDKRYICHYCNYPFTDKSNLAKHILIHEGKQQLYKCDLCQKTFSSQSSLVIHKRIHTGEKPFICNYCPKSFSNRRMLVEHQRIHTGEKPYKCTVCEQRFTQRGTMKRHMKVHDRLCT